MTPAEARVAQALPVAEALLEIVAADRDDGHAWTPILERVVEDLRGADDTGAPDALRSAHDRYASIIGGMGSFNDYWIPGDDRVSRLRSELYALLRLDAGLLTGGEPVERRCPVCGFPDVAGGGTVDGEICPSCGFQFGVTDADEGISVETWRGRWLAAGMPWSSAGRPPPDGWDPARQLADVTDR